MTSSNTDAPNWEESAKYQQILYAEHLHTVDVCSYDTLLNRLAVTLFGIPEDVTVITKEFSYRYYKKSQQKAAETLAECILENQKDPNKDKIYYNIVCVYGRTKDKKLNFQEWVYRIPGKENIIFIDRNCRVYKVWDDYLKNNILPKAQICYPEKGKYTTKKKQKVKFMDTPSCSLKNDVLLGVDITTTASSLAAGGICTAALFVPIAAPIVWTAIGISAASGLWGAGRSIDNLADRVKHDQTLNFLDSQARAAWLGATVPFIGLLAGGANAAVAVSRTGVALSQGVKTAVKVVNGINCGAQATYVLHNIYSIIETKMNGDKVSTLQIFQLIASSLLFANAVVNAYQARLLLENMATGDTEGFYTKISNSQTENGIQIRPTTYLTNVDIPSMINISIPYGCVLLRIPPDISSSIVDITIYIMNNRRAEMSGVLIGLLPHLRTLWQKIDDHVNERHYDNQWNEEFYRRSNQEEKTHSSTTHTNMSERKDLQNICNDESITIIDIDWEGQKKTVQEAVDQVFYKEKVSKIDVIKFYHFFLARIKGEVAEKEKEFQKCLTQIPNISEDELDKIYNIRGDRIQFFANEIMKSYKDVKLIAMKQSYMKMVHQEGLQVPLYSGSACQYDIVYYTSIQKNGTQSEKFLKILEQAKVLAPLNLCTVYSSNEFYFLEIHDPQSKYAMAGAVNFGDKNNMKGFIIIEKKF